MHDSEQGDAFAQVMNAHDDNRKLAAIVKELQTRTEYLLIRIQHIDNQLQNAHHRITVLEHK